MGRRRDERDTLDGMARPGNDLVHLETRQLTALAGLGALRHLDLQLLGIHQIFSRHAEPSAGHLLGLRREAHAIHLGVVAGIVLAALTRVAACAEPVHGQRQGLVGLDAQCAKAHGTRHKVTYDALHRLHVVDGRRHRGSLEAEEIAQEDGALFFINPLRPFLELRVRPKASGRLQTRDGFGIPGMKDAVPAPGKLAVVG